MIAIHLIFENVEILHRIMHIPVFWALINVVLFYVNRAAGFESERAGPDGSGCSRKVETSREEYRGSLG